MKKIFLTVLALIICASMPIMAGNGSFNTSQSGYNPGCNNGYNPGYNGNHQIDQNDHAVVSLLWLVYSDLQMCCSSLNQSLMDNISAIGHLNNARSALRKSNLDPAYSSLIAELDKRIGKIKFYLVMNDRRAVLERAQQLMAVIRNLLGGNTGNLPGGYNGYNPYNPGYPGYHNGGGYNPGYNNGYNPNYGNPNGSGYIPTKPEFPVGQGGQHVGGTTVLPTIPSGVVPVR